jgi:hypothetical protein
MSRTGAVPRANELAGDQPTTPATMVSDFASTTDIRQPLPAESRADLGEPGGLGVEKPGGVGTENAIFGAEGFALEEQSLAARHSRSNRSPLEGRLE